MEYVYLAEEAPRGKHTRTRGRRRRENPVSRAAKVAFAGVAAAAVAGSISYGAVSMVGHDTAGSDSAQIDLAAPARTSDERASRSGGNCGRTGTGQARVERYLSTQAARFGQITMDAKQDAADCAVIKKFQAAVALPTATGIADETTAEVADRLYKSTPASCGAETDKTTVCVDLSHQTLWVMRDGSVIFAPVVVRTGGPGLATPTGEYEITEKKVETVSSEYGTKLPYWQRFFEDFGLHATDTSLYTDPDDGSHGCVNLLAGDAKTVYGLTDVGTEVRVFGHRAGT
ncbi:L,D-transpeptidase [Cryptosporangium aurantiacum]|uniref:Lipoprotein-anchoring transpeptidase ErfK/SrfK n=1 Tax=Cryptosporangium aurantiacum TaxID=134849 RepID=A0A1M7N247_9ACTN|nr:L,D-transpeptidase [Cryptosporangium aurantiacum]SHM97410.1 Lipoprotein-anchoring transpeptidase ErfK/SrfK [Cryptosporangium aurantiacum]